MIALIGLLVKEGGATLMVRSFTDLIKLTHCPSNMTFCDCYLVLKAFQSIIKFISINYRKLSRIIVIVTSTKSRSSLSSFDATKITLQQTLSRLKRGLKLTKQNEAELNQCAAGTVC